MFSFVNNRSLDSACSTEDKLKSYLSPPCSQAATETPLLEAGSSPGEGTQWGPFIPQWLPSAGHSSSRCEAPSPSREILQTWEVFMNKMIH